MDLEFRIGRRVPDGAANIAHINAPVVSPENSVVSYDFSGSYVDNIATYPDQSRYATATFNGKDSLWYIRSMFSSDFSITNKVITRRSVKRAVPLNYRFTSALPLKSTTAYWDEDLKKIIGKESLIAQYEILGKDRLITRDLLHDVDFIPYHVFRGTDPYDLFNRHLFFVIVYTQHINENLWYYIRYSSFDDGLQITLPQYTKVISTDNNFSLFNIIFAFKNGFGADLLGHAYPNSKLNPVYTFDPDALITDPDIGTARKDSQYTLFYDYKERNYNANLQIPASDYWALREKPTPMFLIHFAAKVQSLSGVVEIDTVNGRLILTEPVDNPRQFVYPYLGRSTFEVVDEINNDNTLFTATELLRFEELKNNDFFIETSDTFLPAEDKTGSTTQLFDESYDGGTIVRSNKFIVRYNSEARIKIKQPYSADPTSEWKPVLKLGGFADEKDNAYFLNEFASRDWSDIHGFPFVDVRGETANYITSKIIQAARYPIRGDARSIRIYTTDQEFTGVVEDVDAHTGKIFLSEEINEPIAFIDYSYRERFVEYKSANLNPSAPFYAPIGKFLHIFIKPLITSGGETAFSTISHDVLDALGKPQDFLDKLLIGAYLIVDVFAEEDYKITKTATTGGGLKPELSKYAAKKKFAEIENFFDYGSLDGVPYPANSVVFYRFPTIIQGIESILLEDYDTDQTFPNRIKVYNAVNIEPGMKLTLIKGLIEEQVTAIGSINHDVVEISFAPSQNFAKGTVVRLSKAIKPLLSKQKLEETIKKYQAAGTHAFIEFGQTSVGG